MSVGSNKNMCSYQFTSDKDRSSLRSVLVLRKVYFRKNYAYHKLLIDKPVDTKSISWCVKSGTQVA